MDKGRVNTGISEKELIYELRVRDKESALHSSRVKEITGMLLRAYVRLYPECGYSKEDIKPMFYASLFHDVGKVKIGDEVLLKHGKLTDSEFEVMKKHTTIGCEMLEELENKETDFYKYCYEICRYHHERYDGSGYPDGLKGEEIPIWVQLVSIADAYDALVCPRSYKEAIARRKAIRMIVKGECGMFGPVALQCFKACKKEILNIDYDKSVGVEGWVRFVNVDKEENEEERQKIQDILDEMATKNKKGYWWRKRVLSILLSLACISFFALPMLIIALVIWLGDIKTSPIFCQKRVGRHGEEFTLYKFRTMVSGAEKMQADIIDKNEMDGPVFKIKDDPRITKFGKFLRKTSLDELPQFFNVLKGDMVVIGPRPPLPREVESYTEYHRLRLVVTPGITCLWQVQPKRNEIAFDEWVNLDIHYILHRSLLMDIGIIAKTAWVMLRKEGR